MKRCKHESGHRRRGRKLVVAAALVLTEAALLKVRAGRFGGNVVVRCRAGHLYTTIWIPGASLKSLRFGWWRLQWCPVGRHWSIVTPARASELTADQQREAGEARDIRIP